MILFRLLFVVDVAVALVLTWFFVVGLADRSVSSGNMPLWIGMLGGVAAVLFGALRLSASGRTGLANLLLAVPAVPGLLSGLFVLAMVLLRPNWR